MTSRIETLSRQMMWLMCSFGYKWPLVVDSDDILQSSHSSFLPFLPFLLPLSLSDARTHLLSSFLTALMMAFLPLLTSPIVLSTRRSGPSLRRLDPSLRRSGPSQKASSTPLSRSTPTSLVSHIRSFSPLSSALLPSSSL